MPADRYEAEARALLASSTTGDTARERGEWDSYDAWRASPNDVCADIAAALRAAERRGAERMRERCRIEAIAWRNTALAARLERLPLEEPSDV
jgi:hypothetical protein